MCEICCLHVNVETFIVNVDKIVFTSEAILCEKAIFICYSVITMSPNNYCRLYVGLAQNSKTRDERDDSALVEKNSKPHTRCRYG